MGGFYFCVGFFTWIFFSSMDFFFLPFLFFLFPSFPFLYFLFFPYFFFLCLYFFYPSAPLSTMTAPSLDEGDTTSVTNPNQQSQSSTNSPRQVMISFIKDKTECIFYDTYYEYYCLYFSYSLIVRQQPEKARLCSFKEKGTPYYTIHERLCLLTNSFLFYIVSFY